MREGSPPPSCHVSYFTGHVSCVTCHMSHVMCHFFHVFLLQSGEASWWRVCYQRGVPRLVLIEVTYQKETILTTQSRISVRKQSIIMD